MDFPLPIAQPTTRISEGGILAKYCSNSLHICRWETPVMFKTNGALTNCGVSIAQTTASDQKLLIFPPDMGEPEIIKMSGAPTDILEVYLPS
ncbi:hypothetical protein RDI58_022160 [Solanum bulbocastanum]|uniref:Uncharacterized protein n=1 Tax=Solanum bulbocastanum TaxID=147425 RepID=A0AAN8TA24_SOLBU